jgi:hypothetical protein
MVTIGIDNNGPEIVSTNYWDTNYARKGYVFLSINAGTCRLLVPEAMLAAIPEWRAAREVIVSKGPWPDQGKAEALELLFEDDSDSPYALHIGTNQVDRIPLPADQDHADQPARWRFSTWTQIDGKVLELPCRYRIVTRIPWLKSFCEVQR